METIRTYPGAVLMTNEDYHANTSHVSKSGLDLIARSPLHYWAKYLDPNRQPEERKQHFIIGSAVHAAILEPHLFERSYFSIDDASICAQIGGAKPRATNKYKEWLEAQLAANEGRQMLSVDDWQHCLNMRDAVRRHPAAAMLLQDGFVEQSFFFNDLQTDAPVKIRPDHLNHNLRWIVDVKTTDDASPSSFGKTFYSYSYHKQAALLFDGMSTVDADQWAGVAFIAVEKEPPYAVAVYYATDADIEEGRRAYRGNLLTYMECRSTNQWPSYSEGLEPIQRPGWMK